MVLAASSLRCLSRNRRITKSWLLAFPASWDATQDGQVDTILALADARCPKRRCELGMRTHLDAMVDGALFHMRGEALGCVEKEEVGAGGIGLVR